MPIAIDLASSVEERLLARNALFEQFFAREAPRLASACREMSERFLRGGRLLAFGRGPYATDAQHVSVEFVHPVIVGKRALPALDLSVMFGPWVEALVRPDDMVMGFGPPDGDAHPQYRSTALAPTFGVAEVVAVQHHRAHVASVLAERGAWEQRLLGISLDGTGYGDDGTIWGGELFVGSIREGFDRVAHLRPAALVGGDAAARHPVQAAVGFLEQLHGLPDLARAPFEFPPLYQSSRRLLQTRTRFFTTTSAGRLFDAAAALLGFTRPVTFEGQAAMWLEQLARASRPVEPYPCPLDGASLDWRSLLRGVMDDRIRGRDRGEIAGAFHAGLARGLRDAAVVLCGAHGLDTVAASGGVFQNGVLLELLATLLERDRIALWINHLVPPNDGGISLGQAALGALGPCTSSR